MITGASSGIGAAFAHRLAAEGYELALVARRKERLAALVSELNQQYRTVAKFLVADLSNDSDIAQIESHIIELENLEIVINNAGFGTTGKFVQIDLKNQMDLVWVHVIAAMRLCRAALPGMVARTKGAIINVSSIGAFLPAPGNATYNATKAFLISFSVVR